MLKKCPLFGELCTVGTRSGDCRPLLGRPHFSTSPSSVFERLGDGDADYDDHKKEEAGVSFGASHLVGSLLGFTE